MAYRPLNEYDEKKGSGGEILRYLTKKINDALDYLFSLANNLTGKTKKSITTDTDGKAQLVNDLDDSQLLPNLVYGTDENGNRGFIRTKNYKNFVISDWIFDGESFYIVFTHNLGTTNVIISVYENNKQVIPDEVEILNENSVKIKATERFNGKIVIWG